MSLLQRTTFILCLVSVHITMMQIRFHVLFVPRFNIYTYFKRHNKLHLKFLEEFDNMFIKKPKRISELWCVHGAH